jgi:hypothetical protein
VSGRDCGEGGLDARQGLPPTEPEAAKMNGVILLACHGRVAISSRGRFSRDEFLTRKNALLFLVHCFAQRRGVKFLFLPHQ